MGKCTERLYNGVVKENPTFVLMLGMCPTLAVTTSAINGAGMGLATTCILVMSNMVISMLRKVIPDKVRIPAYIVIIASFVTIIQFLMEAYFPSLNSSLGLYIPLIVVNCIILGRAESYASKNKVFPSIFDGLGMGLGFTIGLTVIGIFRELIGSGSIFDFKILGEGNIWQEMSVAGQVVGDVLEHYTPIAIFVRAPGAFLVLAFLVAFINKRNAVKAAKAGDGVATCRQESCATCTNTMCGGKIFTAPVVSEPEVPADSETPKPAVVIPEKIERKPVEEAEPQEAEKKESETTPDTAEKVVETASETAESALVEEQSISEHSDNTETSETQAVTDEQVETEEGSEKEQSEEVKLESEEEQPKEEPKSELEEEKSAEESSEESVPETEVAEQSEESVPVAETEEQSEKSVSELENEKQTEENIPRAKVQEVVGNTEEIQGSMHESDVVSTSKLTRPDVADASMVDKYEEFAEMDGKQKKRKRKNKRGKGGKQ